MDRTRSERIRVQLAQAAAELKSLEKRASAIDASREWDPLSEATRRGRERFHQASCDLVAARARVDRLLILRSRLCLPKRTRASA